MSRALDAKYGVTSCYVLQSYSYDHTEVVPGTTTLYELLTTEKRGTMRFACTELVRGIWACGACGTGRITQDTLQCNICGRKAKIGND